MYRSYRKEREQDIKNVLLRWMGYTCASIERNAKQYVPKGATGLLRKSIKSFVEFPVSIVCIGEHYAHFVEGIPRIVRRHFLGWRGHPSFTRWGRQRGYDTSRGGLLVWGYAIPFFKKSIDAAIPAAMAALRRLRI